MAWSRDCGTAVWRGGRGRRGRRGDVWWCMARNGVKMSSFKAGGKTGARVPGSAAAMVRWRSVASVNDGGDHDAYCDDKKEHAGARLR